MDLVARLSLKLQGYSLKPSAFWVWIFAPIFASWYLTLYGFALVTDNRRKFHYQAHFTFWMLVSNISAIAHVLVKD